MVEKITQKFLDYEIIDCSNEDGIVLTKPGAYSYECHLGNYKTIGDAKKAAVIFFMIARPQEFATHLYHRSVGTRTHMEYFKFIAVLRDEMIECPPEIGHTNSMNMFLTFNGKKL